MATEVGKVRAWVEAQQAARASWSPGEYVVYRDHEIAVFISADEPSNPYSWATIQRSNGQSMVVDGKVVTGLESFRCPISSLRAAPSQAEITPVPRVRYNVSGLRKRIEHALPKLSRVVEKHLCEKSVELVYRVGKRVNPLELTLPRHILESEKFNVAYAAVTSDKDGCIVLTMSVLATPIPIKWREPYGH